LFLFLKSLFEHFSLSLLPMNGAPFPVTEPSLLIDPAFMPDPALEVPPHSSETLSSKASLALRMGASVKPESTIPSWAASPLSFSETTVWSLLIPSSQHRRFSGRLTQSEALALPASCLFTETLGQEKDPETSASSSGQVPTVSGAPVSRSFFQALSRGKLGRFLVVEPDLQHLQEVVQPWVRYIQMLCQLGYPQASPSVGVTTSAHSIEDLLPTPVLMGEGLLTKVFLKLLQKQLHQLRWGLDVERLMQRLESRLIRCPITFDAFCQVLKTGEPALPLACGDFLIASQWKHQVLHGLNPSLEMAYAQQGACPQERLECLAMAPRYFAWRQLSKAHQTDEAECYRKGMLARGLMYDSEKLKLLPEASASAGHRSSRKKGQEPGADDDTYSSNELISFKLWKASIHES
jgi:hypothetical protein